MAGSAILGDNLVDDLVPTADELRSELYQDMGVTQWGVHLVRRRWSGTERGEGVPTIISDVAMDPTPLFVDSDRWQRMAHGKDTQGRSALREVSLTYTAAELGDVVIPKNEEFYYRLVDIRGQAQNPAYYVLAAPPVADRERTIGWTLELERAEIEE